MFSFMMPIDSISDVKVEEQISSWNSQVQEKKQVPKSIKQPMLISENRNKKTSTKKAKTTKKIQDINLNKSKVQDLANLDGIHPKLASRILKYRDILGGYVDKKQLKEVYYINEKEIGLLSKHSKIDLSLVKRIKINEASFKELLKHPYLKYQQVKAIFSLKRSITNIDSFSQIQLKVDSLNPLLEYYLIF